MSIRRVSAWSVFWAGVCVVLATLSWASFRVYQLEEQSARAQGMAQRQELIRLALWRIDSRIAPIIALEASRPYSDYEQLQMSSGTRFQGAFSQEVAGQAFSGQPQSFALEYFQYDQEKPEAIATERSYQYEDQENGEALISDSLLELTETADSPAPSSQPASNDSSPLQKDYDFAARKAIADRVTQNSAPSAVDDEFSDDAQERARETVGLAAKVSSELDADTASEGLTSATDEFSTIERMISNRAGAIVGGLTPQWVLGDDGGNQLVLVRTVEIDGQRFTQGVRLDWQALSTDLLDSVDDIMPTALITPMPWSEGQDAYPLATIPAGFIPGGAVALPAQTLTPAMIAMVVTWIAIVVAIASIGVVLRAAILLSDRRGMFVSAVTHELRTPLTTFRLYSQMLADGMVSDEDVRKDYLQILKRESERLTGIVENVLEYARLTRQRSSKDKAAGVQTLTPGALIARFRPALARRAGQSNLDLVVSMDIEAHADRTLTADPHAVERIMMNLIENACKYAAPSDEDAGSIEDADTRIHLDMSINDDMLELLVADHGSGIAPGEAGQIFGEFQRGWRGLSNARSGLGLGLALSRGLAREMGGDLILTKRRGHGAEFLLTIPLDILA